MINVKKFTRFGAYEKLNIKKVMNVDIQRRRFVVPQAVLNTL